MGVNIYANTYIDGKCKGKIENWDSARYSGDSELMTADFEWEFLDNDEYELICRPIDLDAAIQWVKLNIVKPNQVRLIDLFQSMKTDKNIYITFSI